MGQSTSKDMAVCFVIFNPAESKRILMNYLYTVNLLNLQEIPNFTMELAFEDKPFELKKSPNVFQVRSNSYMFHKERMCRIIEKKIPKKFTKLVFMDADLIFSDNSWYEKTSNLLNTYDAVQCFENCHWMDLSYTKVMLTRPTALKMKGNVFDHMYHPGFVWAFRRDWYKKAGFFDICVSGSGDSLSVAAWMNKVFHPSFKCLPLSMKPAFDEFRKLPKPKMTYLEGIDIYHLYHGSRKNRKYVDRHRDLNINIGIYRLLAINKDGMYEWTDTRFWNKTFKDYFESREDDGYDDEELTALSISNSSQSTHPSS